MKLRKFRRTMVAGVVVLGVGWYQENQWDLLLEHAEDKEGLFPTYAGWLENACENLKTGGIRCPLPKVEDLINWWKENKVPLNGQSKSNNAPPLKHLKQTAYAISGCLVTDTAYFRNPNYHLPYDNANPGFRLYGGAGRQPVAFFQQKLNANLL